MKKTSISIMLFFNVFIACAMAKNDHYGLKKRKQNLLLNDEKYKKYWIALNHALDMGNNTELFLLLYNCENFLIDCCLSIIVKNCCTAFKYRQFDKYKRCLNLLTNLLNTGLIKPKLIDLKKAITYTLVHLVKLLVSFMSYKDTLDLCLCYAFKQKDNLVKKIRKHKLENAGKAYLNKKKYKLILLEQIISILCLVNCADKSIKYILDEKLLGYLKYLLEKKAFGIKEPNCRLTCPKLYECCDYEITPLQYVIHYSYFTIVKILLKYGADPNYFLENTTPPLIIAVKNGNYKIIKLLLIYKANPNLTDLIGNDALYYALKFGNQRIIDLLLWSDI